VPTPISAAASAPTAAPPLAPGPPGAGGLRSCPSCSQLTPSGFAFCQHCGFRMAAPGGAAATPAMPAAPAAPPAPAAPFGEAATLAASGPAAAAAAIAAARPVGDAYMPTLAPSAPALAALGTLQGASGQHPASAPRRAPTPVGGVPVTPAPAAPVAAAGAAWGRLVAVNRDGSDGQAFALEGELVAIGRSDATIRFPDDRYLAARHAQLERRGGQIVLRVLDEINGAYLRLTEPTALSDGDQFLFGKQVLRFEVVSPAERDAPPVMQHGVMRFGTPPRPAWGRVAQLLTTGQTRDVMHLLRAEVSFGREDADVRFPDDEFMSRRHCSLSSPGGRAHLVDLGSSNGTYLRLRHERVLRSGDHVRLGDQLLRLELP
jgi:pSer/pThr/pTyr-binding forkhead associated (FHA) protein